jgi:xylan 1,4-beta-xylosidase
MRLETHSYLAFMLGSLFLACGGGGHKGGPSAGGAGGVASGGAAGTGALGPFVQATYDNPVLPGDHPDMNIFQENGEFYVTGSDFQMAPYVEILHSSDLIHWERVSRVVDAAYSGLSTTAPGQGTWGGFIVKFGGYYWVYYAINYAQWFSRSESLAGPWSAPVAVSGKTGYDDSVFVDDDGKAYMVMKSDQCANGYNAIREIGPDGQLTGTLIDLSFVNNGVGGCPDWAEGPSMTKRNGFYYYFDSTHTGCGGREVVWRSSTLSSNAADWENLGNFLLATNTWSGSQHSTAPFQIADGTWWTLYHSYECTGTWRGLGRQGLLSQVTWTDDVPKADAAPLTATAPALPPSGIPFLLPVNDEFAADRLSPAWTFYGYAVPERYSLVDRPGWLRIKPASSSTTYVVQKSALHANAMVAKLDFLPLAAGDAAGIRIGNPDNTIEVSVARVWQDGDNIRFAFGTTSTSVPSPAGSTVWLKLVRGMNQATGFFSTDRITYTQVGDAIDITTLDNFNGLSKGWVGNQAGMFAANSPADFDAFSYRDGFTDISASDTNQQSGTAVVASATAGSVLAQLENDDWAMYGSIDTGSGGVASQAIEFSASAPADGAAIEVWLDPGSSSAPAATCPILGTGDFDTFGVNTCALATKGTHEVYLRFKGGTGELLRLARLRFVPVVE